MRYAFLPLCLMLGACAPGPNGETPTRAATATQAVIPPIKTFSTPRPLAPTRSNIDIQRDFLELAFELESGRTLSVFSRFEGPISVRVTGAPPPTLAPDLNQLIQRMRNEAGINIRQTNDARANITIQAVTRAEIKRFLPKAACFVVPNITDLSQYRSARRSRSTSWSSLETRKTLAIFLPNDASPQEARDCLHEELAQAIGPLNDLYRLRDSVFNDDNVHTVLTGFDMLILRAFYAPELRSGMSRDQVAQRLPAILSRLNPRGDRLAPEYPQATPRAWVRAIQTALGPGARPNQRRAAAQEALNIAQAANWTDHRRAFSHFALGRLTHGQNPDFAYKQFQIADKFYQRTPGTELHRAYTATQLAAHAISRDQGDKALAIIRPHLATAERFENAALLANLLLLQAEALDLTGRRDAARDVRLDSLGWARYGFGADVIVRAKVREISSLSPRNGPNG